MRICNGRKSLSHHPATTSSTLHFPRRPTPFPLPANPLPIFPPTPFLLWNNIKTDKSPPQNLAIQETLAIFPPLRQRITAAVQKLEDQLEAAQEESGAAPAEEVARAKEVLAEAKRAVLESEVGKEL